MLTPSCEKTARKYFGTKSPIGELIHVNDSVLLLVTGVFQDLPHNTHLAFDLIVSMTGIPLSQFPYLMSTTYIKIDQHTVLDDLMKEVNKNSAKYWAAELNRFPDVKAEIFYQPLKDVAFSAPYERDCNLPRFLFSPWHGSITTTWRPRE
jgi:putative ABC transport system permease protein